MGKRSLVRPCEKCGTPIHDICIWCDVLKPKNEEREKEKGKK